MKTFILSSILILAVTSQSHAQLAQPASDATRRVCVTIDDLPIVSRNFKDAVAWQQMTDRLLNALTVHRVEAVGFVNEAKIHRGGRVDSARLELLNDWLDAEMELANHTYSHPNLHRVSVTEYMADIVKGEKYTTALLSQRNSALRYFRHPYLRTGRSLGVKDSLEQFLAERNYTIAPVTIDNSEWIYALAYDIAVSTDDTVLAAEIGWDYLRYMEDVIAYYEEQSVALLGYELPQILLIHANLINADYLEALLDIFVRRGYRFITLAKALEDPAYQMEDKYVGPAGITWLHRWALTAGKRGDFFAGEPEVPGKIRQAARMGE